MDILTWFHDRSNITFAIAIIGFVISLYNFFRAMWDRRCAFTVEYISHNCTLGRMGHTQFIIRMNIQNQTSASLCIVRMFLVYENQTYEFVFPAQQVWEFTSTHGKTVTNKKEIFSQEMPFSIHGHGVQGAYFVAYLPETLRKELKKSCKFKIVIQTKNKKKQILSWRRALVQPRSCPCTQARSSYVISSKPRFNYFDGLESGIPLT